MVKTTSGFYVAGGGVSPLANGLATAADWISAASFISMAGLISFMGYAGSIYLLGWTGGYVLLALLLAPYLRKFGKFTVPDFVGDRYYSDFGRLVALLCAIIVSFTYVAGQIRGVGIIFSRFLEVDVNTGVLIGMAIVCFYASLGGMKGITYTQVAQYVVLIIAYLVPAVAISMKITGSLIPQTGFGSTIMAGPDSGRYLLDVVNQLNTDLGFAEYTRAFGPGSKPMLDIFCITMALMVGTAGLPHVIIRFYSVPNVRAARLSAGYALLFIAIFYTTAPAIAAFARYSMLNTISGIEYTEAPSWFRNWEKTGLIAWTDKNQNGTIEYFPDAPFAGKPVFTGEKGSYGQELLANTPTDNNNELYIDNDIIVLANPEITNLPPWVIALVAAGGLAAALSTVSCLLLVISSSISHDLYYRLINRNASEKNRLLVGRLMIGLIVCIAGYFGINPPGFVAQVVAFAFGLAASSFFPVIVLGIFSKRVNREGAICGMTAGISFTIFYIVHNKYLGGSPWCFGISAEGIGTIGMLINFLTTLLVSRFTAPPPAEVQEMVENIRFPRGAGAGIDH
jgi:cation/acetate symporter